MEESLTRKFERSKSVGVYSGNGPSRGSGRSTITRELIRLQGRGTVKGKKTT